MKKQVPYLSASYNEWAALIPIFLFDWIFSSKILDIALTKLEMNRKTKFKKLNTKNVAIEEEKLIDQ